MDSQLLGKSDKDAILANTRVQITPINESPTENVHPLRDGAFVPQGWPQEPKPIAQSCTTRVLNIATDIILLGLSLLFLIVAFIARSYNDTYVDDHPAFARALNQATLFGPTVFPILFAIVLSRAAHSILLWRLQLGESVGTLNLLAGSTSLASTVTSQLRLKLFTFTGVILFLIWAFSPVGGQAARRLVAYGDKFTTSPTVVTYMEPDGNLVPYYNTEQVTLWSLVATLFSASLIASAATKSSSVDLWNNVKIPRIENCERSSSPDREGWFATGSACGNMYSSLVCVPMAGIDNPKGNYSLAMHAQYLNIECPVLNVTRKNSSAAAIGASIGIQPAQDRTRTLIDHATLPARNFSFFSADFETRQLEHMSQCSMTTTYVEASVICNFGTSCSVNSIRRSRALHPPKAFTLLDMQEKNWESFVMWFTKAIPGQTNLPSIQTQYLSDPDNPLETMEHAQGDLFSSTPYTAQQFEERLGQIMNTFWSITNALHAIPGGMTTQTAFMNGSAPPANVDDPDYQPATDGASTMALLTNSTNTTGTITTKADAIYCDTRWMIALCFASLVMIFACLVAPVLREFFIRIPDIQLNVSGLAMLNNSDSKYSSLGTYMDSSDRALRAKNIKLRFGDAEAAKATRGRLSIAPIDLARKVDGTTIRSARRYA